MDTQFQTEIFESLNEFAKKKGETCKALNEFADELDVHHHRLKIAKTSFASGGIIGSVLAITGIALTPVTFGASLGLTIAGTVIGISSGVGGVASQIIERVLKSKTLARAKEKIDSYVALKVQLLTQLGEIKEQSELSFYTLVQDCIKEIDVVLHNEIVKVVMAENTGNSTTSGRSFLHMFVTAGIAAGKIATEAVDFATDFAHITSGAAKIGGIVLAAVSIPLDIVTIVRSSISIHKKTPAEAAEEVRKMERDLQEVEVNKEKHQKFADNGKKRLRQEHAQREDQRRLANLTVENLKRRLEEEQNQRRRAINQRDQARRISERTTRQQTAQMRKWCEEVAKLGVDTNDEMRVLSIEFDFVSTLSLEVKLFWLLTHVLLSFILFLTEFLFRGKSDWFSYFIALGVIYDTFLILSYLGTPFIQNWVIYKVKNKMESNRAFLRRFCRTVADDLPSLEDLSTFDSIHLATKYTTRNFMQTCLTTSKLAFTLSVFFRYRHMGRTFEILGSYLLLDAPTRGFMLLDGPISTLAGAVGFVQYPVGESITVKPDLMKISREVIILLIWVFLTVLVAVEYKQYSTSQLSKSIITLGEDFNTRLGEIVNCVTETTEIENLTSV